MATATDASDASVFFTEGAAALAAWAKNKQERMENLEEAHVVLQLRVSELERAMQEQIKANAELQRQNKHLQDRLEQAGQCLRGLVVPGRGLAGRRESNEFPKEFLAFPRNCKSF
jgi:hypothetical protein|tara:strand:+ start:285 stop:629 length:345 start_codon:yes stop_codon:yes gene_type:complete